MRYMAERRPNSIVERKSLWDDSSRRRLSLIKEGRNKPRSCSFKGCVYGEYRHECSSQRVDAELRLRERLRYSKYLSMLVSTEWLILSAKLSSGVRVHSSTAKRRNECAATTTEAIPFHSDFIFLRIVSKLSTSLLSAESEYGTQPRAEIGFPE